MTDEQILKIAQATPDIGSVKHEEFTGYIMPIAQRKKSNDGWQTIENPYMTVDGRVMMANIDHIRQDKRLDYLPPQVLVDNDEQLTLLVTVDSEVYGKRHGIASSNKTKDTAEGINPWEVAETSAVGRALAQFGYGVFAGSGVSSANDMTRVAARQNQQSAATTTRPATATQGENKGAYARTHPPLSPVQKTKLLELYRLLNPGLDDSQVNEGLDTLFVESFKHGLDAATYEEGARLTGTLLSEIRKGTNASAGTTVSTPTPPKPVQTERGGLCSTHNEPTHEYKKADGVLFWYHKHNGTEPCTAEPKPETIVSAPLLATAGGAK